MSDDNEVLRLQKTISKLEVTVKNNHSLIDNLMVTLSNGKQIEKLRRDDTFKSMDFERELEKLCLIVFPRDGIDGLMSRERPREWIPYQHENLYEFLVGEIPIQRMDPSGLHSPFEFASIWTLGHHRLNFSSELNPETNIKIVEFLLKFHDKIPKDNVIHVQFESEFDLTTVFLVKLTNLSEYLNIRSVTLNKSLNYIENAQDTIIQFLTSKTIETVVLYTGSCIPLESLIAVVNLKSIPHLEIYDTGDQFSAWNLQSNDPRIKKFAKAISNGSTFLNMEYVDHVPVFSDYFYTVLFEEYEKKKAKVSNDDIFRIFVKYAHSTPEKKDMSGYRERKWRSLLISELAKFLTPDYLIWPDGREHVRAMNPTLAYYYQLRRVDLYRNMLKWFKSLLTDQIIGVEKLSKYINSDQMKLDIEFLGPQFTTRLHRPWSICAGKMTESRIFREMGDMDGFEFSDNREVLYLHELLKDK